MFDLLDVRTALFVERFDKFLFFVELQLFRTLEVVLGAFSEDPVELELLENFCGELQRGHFSDGGVFADGLEVELVSCKVP